MASMNLTWLHCINQMGKTHSKPLAARHGRGTAWARRAMCESAFIISLLHVSMPTHYPQGALTQYLLHKHVHAVLVVFLEKISHSFSESLKHQNIKTVLAIINYTVMK